MFEFSEKDAMVDVVSTGKVLDTGIYDVKIVTASKDVASTGAIGINWQVHVEGAKYPNMVYGMWVARADGSRLFSMDIVNGLQGIAGAKKLTEYQKEVEIKDGKKKVTAFKELDNIKCKVAIVKKFDWYQGAETEKNEIKRFFTESGHTFAESKLGGKTKQLNYMEANMKDTYTDEWKKAKADGEMDGNNGDAAEEAGDTAENSGSIL